MAETMKYVDRFRSSPLKFIKNCDESRKIKIKMAKNGLASKPKNAIGVQGKRGGASAQGRFPWGKRKGER